MNWEITKNFPGSSGRELFVSFTSFPRFLWRRVLSFISWKPFVCGVFRVYFRQIAKKQETSATNSQLQVFGVFLHFLLEMHRNFCYDKISVYQLKSVQVFWLAFAASRRESREAEEGIMCISGSSCRPERHVQWFARTMYRKLNQCVWCVVRQETKPR